jgi:hypothetical protein
LSRNADVLKLNLLLNLEANDRSVETTKTTMVTVQYITPIMVTIGICSMNEHFIPFDLSTRSLLVAVVAVFALFSLLQRVHSAWQDNPKWWRNAPEYLSKKGTDISSTMIGWVHGRAAAGPSSSNNDQERTLE